MHPVLLIWLGFGCLGLAYATFVMPGYPKKDETSPAAMYVAYLMVFVLGPIFITTVLIGLVTDLRARAKERS